MILLSGSRIRASTSCTQVTVQAIYASKEEPDREWWGAKDYRILDVPFLNCRYDGHPPYEAITQSHPILHNGDKSVGAVECNLLCLLGIRIEHDPSGKPLEVRLNLEDAKEVKGVTTTIEEAAEIALECIRVVANRYGGAKIQVIIVPPNDSVAKWKAVEQRFNGHDLSKPFIKP